MAAAVYSSQVSTMALASSSVAPQPPNEEQYFTFFCRALYDYQTDNESSLSFHKDDIIEVLTKLESGWWDGLLGQERGWFPSNYVTVISDQEADAALSAAESVAAAAVAQSNPSMDYQTAVVGWPQTHQTQTHDWGQQLQTEVNSAAYQAARVHRATGSSVFSSDFWVPQVSSDGRIYYMNTQTGQHSRDLPQEVDQDISDGELAGLATPPNSRNAALGMGTSTNGPGVADHTPGGQAGFGVPARSGTPEPWKKVLADDGMSYCYVNTVDGSVSWTVPSSDRVASQNDRSALQRDNFILSSTANVGDRETTLVNSVSEPPTRRLRSHSEASQPTTDRNQSTDRFSIHSDDSGIQPSSRGRSESGASLKRNGVMPNGPSPLKMKPRPPQKIHQLTSSEQSAQSLQRALAPPPPDSVNDLSAMARETIGSVVQFLQSNDVMSQPTTYGQELNERVLAVVYSVRDLLYVCASPSGHIPGHLYPRDARHPRPTHTSQTMQAHLKSAQRKVAGTLSKLVLSTLAIQYDTGTSSNDKPLRMEADASELERAIIAFVLEVQRFLHQNPYWLDQNAIKRLHGVFSVQNIGMGLPGAGAAASWSGFGWLALDEMVDPPNRLLSIEVVSELKSHVFRIEARRVQFAEPSSESSKSPDMLAKECYEFSRHLHACILFICNIHVARHVDIDGIHIDNEHSANRGLYLQTVDRARHLVRTLEVVVQALYDDSAAFFLSTQTLRSNTADPCSSRNAVLQLALTVKDNLELVYQTFEALLSVGHDQAELGLGDYNGSIDWRMSRISIIDNQFRNPVFDDPNQDGEQVDLELAFRRPEARTKTSPDILEPVLFYPDLSQISETSSATARQASGEDISLVKGRPSDETSTSTASNTSDAQFNMGLDSETTTFIEDDNPSTSKSPPRGAKLRQILGDDAPQAYIDKVNADFKKWYLRSDASPADLSTDPEGTVRGGTVQALVERLTTHDSPDPKFRFNATFLMTYKSFMTTNELFDLLVKRFWIHPPDGLNPQELDEWKKLKQHLIRLRVLNTFKSMIVDDDILESEEMYIFDRVKEFVSQEEVIGYAAAKQLMITIERAQQGNDIKVTTSTPGALPPPSVIPKQSKGKLKLGDIDSMEMARQLTLMESALYQKIRPTECLQRSRDQKGDNSDNISAMIQFANRMASWVAAAVLSEGTSRGRAGIVKSFIFIADRCRFLHNFSSMIAIVSGLNTPPIRRLKRTWEQVKTHPMSLLSACETTIETNKNFGNYRAILAQIIPPCVPFIGVFLTQLTFINEIPNYIGTDHNLVNFRKRQITAEVIQDIKRWQSIPYNFHPVAPIIDFIQDSLNPFNDGLDLGDHFWNLSLEREPREREDEKMARLLQESGFL